jgi:hypothetical protein
MSPDWCQRCERRAEPADFPFDLCSKCRVEIMETRIPIALTSGVVDLTLADVAVLTEAPSALVAWLWFHRTFWTSNLPLKLSAVIRSPAIA